MNKLKLVQIILKDLEEIKLLSEEVAESENDSTLIIDLALSRTRLLCQEFELLRELSVQLGSLNEETEDDFPEDDEVEVSDVSFSDPELEIVNFEETEFPEDEELSDKVDPEDEETDDEDWKEDEEDDQEDDLIQEDKEVAEDIEQEEDDDEGEDDLTEEDEDEDEAVFEEEVEDVEEEVAESEVEEKEPQQITNIETAHLKYTPQPVVREIQIDDMDDDLEPVKLSKDPAPADRSVMHEIPKPENPVHEKMVVGESFQKERSVNDVIGENKSTEPNLNNGPISSLRASIGLNDRFIFIREIFDNNTDKYNTVIDQLDKLETIQQAVEYLKANLSLQKNETSLKFVDLLKRRFSK